MDNLPIVTRTRTPATKIVWGMISGGSRGAGGGGGGRPLRATIFPLSGRKITISAPSVCLRRRSKQRKK